MIKSVQDIKNARILISNDDGINSEGIIKLERIAKSLSKDVWIVAPESEQSASGHSLTLRSPLRIDRLAKNRYSINGTPTDCVVMAINKIIHDKPPDIVLSGINYGSNIGEDLTYSGTIAVAIEATLAGIPAISLSQACNEKDRNSKIDWSAAEIHAGNIIKRLLSTVWPKNVLINVNFPPVPSKHVKGIEITRMGYRKIGDEIIEGNDPNGRPYFWIGAQKLSNNNPPGTDLGAIQNDLISISPLSINLTHQAMIRKLREAFKEQGFSQDG